LGNGERNLLSAKAAGRMSMLLRLSLRTATTCVGPPLGGGAPPPYPKQSRNEALRSGCFILPLAVGFLIYTLIKIDLFQAKTRRQA
jgi:hypothetical protein